MIFHENRLLADDSHVISCLIFFQKLGKIRQNLSSAAVVIGALRVKLFILRMPHIVIYPPEHLSLPSVCPYVCHKIQDGDISFRIETQTLVSNVSITEGVPT